MPPLLVIERAPVPLVKEPEDEISTPPVKVTSVKTFVNLISPTFKCVLAVAPFVPLSVEEFVTLPVIVTV